MKRMIYKFGKICIYGIVSLLISTLVFYGKSEFFETFRNNLVALLATLSALYMTANSIIVVELNKFKDNYPKADTGKTMKEIKNIFITQIVLIVVLVISFIIKDFLSTLNYDYVYYKPILTIGFNAIAIAIFGYFLEALYDMGHTLFMLVDFNNNDEHKR